MCHILYWQFPKGSYIRIPLKIRPNEHQRWGSGNKVKSRKWTEITLTNFICFTTHNYQLLTPDGQGQVNGAKVNDGQRPEERKNNLNFMDFKVLHAVISSTIIPNQTQSDCYLQASKLNSWPNCSSQIAILVCHFNCTCGGGTIQGHRVIILNCNRTEP